MSPMASKIAGVSMVWDCQYFPGSYISECVVLVRELTGVPMHPRLKIWDFQYLGNYFM